MSSHEVKKSERWSGAADSVVDETRAPVCKRSVTLSHSVVTRRRALTKSGGMAHNLAVWGFCTVQTAYDRWYNRMPAALQARMMDELGIKTETDDEDEWEDVDMSTTAMNGMTWTARTRNSVLNQTLSGIRRPISPRSLGPK